MTGPIDEDAARIGTATAEVIARAELRARIGVAITAVVTVAPLLLRVGTGSSTWVPLVVASAVAVLRLPREIADLIRTRRWAGLVLDEPWKERSIEVRFRPLERHRPLLVRLVGIDGEPQVLGESTSPLTPRLHPTVREQSQEQGDDRSRVWWTCRNSDRCMLLATDDGQHIVEVRRAWTAMGQRSIESRFSVR